MKRPCERNPRTKIKPQSLDESADNVKRAMEKSNEMLVELNEKLDRLMVHLDVPPKPPAGFVKE
ncbi:MAG: hypothetical protein OXG85_11605 [Chloroflexi bacterium]|nr:hypothetical protein [Chloroflexota bacterium]